MEGQNSILKLFFLNACLFPVSIFPLAFSWAFLKTCVLRVYVICKHTNIFSKYYLINDNIYTNIHLLKCIKFLNIKLNIKLTLKCIQFSSVTQSCLTLCDHMDCSTPGFPVHHQFLELTQTHVHWVRDAIRPSHLLSSPSPPTFSLSQHQDLAQWVSSLHQVAKVLEFQLQHQSFQWIFRTYFLY